MLPGSEENVYVSSHTFSAELKRKDFLIKTRGSQTSDLQPYDSVVLMLHFCSIDVIIANQTAVLLARTSNKKCVMFSSYTQTIHHSYIRLCLGNHCVCACLSLLL